MIGVVGESRLVVLFPSEAVERVYTGFAVGAFDPRACRPPLELRDFGGVGQGVADAEQSLDVDTIVDREVSHSHGVLLFGSIKSLTIPVSVG
jgi:hypothetical protein